MIGTKPPSPQSFPRRIPLATAALLLVAACSGGGGGGSGANVAPTIVAAAFVGASSTPQAGETLLLFFSEDVELVNDTLVTDADVTLSGGGTLGSVTASPVLASSRQVTITLGSGVAFTPGTTTITLSPDNDSVRDGAGKLGEAGTPVAIGTSDGQAPTISNVTISGIDGELNGTGSAGGTLQVPPNGWSIDLTFADNGTVDVGSTVISATVSVGSSSGTQLAGVNLVPVLTAAGSTSTTASFLVPSTVTFPQATFTLSCTVVDTSGLASAARTFTARARNFVDSLRPFETGSNPSQLWFLDFSRDVESFTTSPISGGVSVDTNAGANGRSDFEDILRIIGLNNSAPIPNVSAGKDSNVVAQDVYKARLLLDLAALFPGANVGFTLTRPAGTFSSASVPYSSFGYSQISIAGSADNPGVLGIAIFDPSNTTQDDNTLTSYQGSTRLGIFLHTIADAGLGPPSVSTFRQTFGGLAPSLGGTPIGDDPMDGQRLLGNSTINPARDALVTNALQDFARFTAVVVAHECGHSMGLVENGPMPTGLYGNDSTNFSGSSDGHIRNTSLFPPGATNVMSPSLTYSSTINAASAFNTLNLAYLREQIFYGN